MSVAPIGIFDSGLGGLTIWKACKKILPEEQFIYIADQAHCPYGPKSSSVIKKRCRTLVEALLERGSKLIIIACNTATAAAIYDLRADYSIPFVGMEPAIKPAAKLSQSKTIGVLATAGTFKGEHFRISKAKYAEGVEVMVQVGEGLVELIESGKIKGAEAEDLLKKYLLPMREKGVDQLVLGCTHYPFLLKPMQKIMGNGVHIIDPAPAVAKQVVRVLRQESLLNLEKKNAADVFFTSGDPALEQMSLEKLFPMLGEKIFLEKLSI